jgi:hypothetical protein
MDQGKKKAASITAGGLVVRRQEGAVNDTK